MTSLSGTLARPGDAEDTAPASRRAVHPAYRPDVDGLRAVAVLAVVLFHFFPSALPGGFVGVDVFFVISGYLISRIIVDELRQDRFSFAAFYARRCRRIFPALLLVLAAALAFGWIALLPVEYSRLGTHATAGAAFVSNLLLWSESGYFDPAAITKPLLHLWSLGIEEQFYLVWPVILCVAWQLRLNLLLVAAGIALLSFTLNVVATAVDAVEAFYSPATRFWELMVGAILACGEQLRGRRALQVAGNPRFALHGALTGAALVMLGCVLARERSFPGWQALLPTAGAALLILAGPRSPFNRVVLSSPTLVALGLISYPLYLWHWPLLSFARIVHGELGPGMKTALLALSILLAGLTFQLVERPVKAGRHRAAMALALAALMVMAGGAGSVLSANNGLEDRPVVRANVDLQRWIGYRPAPFATDCPFLPAAQQNLFRCQVDRREPPRFALLGDSKAGALFPGVFRAARRGGTWLFLGSGTAGPLVPVLSDSPLYGYVNALAVDTALRTIENTPSVETVVIATATRALFQLRNDDSLAGLAETGNDATALAALDATVSRLIAAGKRVVLVVDNPTLPHMEDCMARKTSSSFFNHLLEAGPNANCRIPLARQMELSRPYRELLDALRQRHPAEVTLFDTLPILCDQGTCGPTREGRFLYGVTDHVSDYASGLLGEALNATLNSGAPGRAR